MADWNLLNSKTAEFTTREVIKDPDGELFEVVYSGLEIKLSQVMEGAPAGGASTVTIYADTLLIDTNTFDARGVVIVARSVDVSRLNGGVMTVKLPPFGGVTVIELMIQEVTGGSLLLTPQGAPAGSGIFTVPAGSDPLRAAFYFVQPDGSVTTEVKSDPQTLQDLTGRPWALNSMRASYTAATWLAITDDTGDSRVAQSMLGWAVAGTRTMTLGGMKIPTDYAELYNQAAALLVTINVQPGAFWVPVLSREFYKDQVDVLLAALQSYENNINTLNVSTNIQQALQMVTATLQGVSQDEAAPMKVQLAQITENVAALRESIGQLQVQFIAQQNDANARFAIMRAAMLSEKAQAFFEAALKISFSPMKIAFDIALMEEDPSALLDAMETFAEAIETSVVAIKEVSEDPPGDPALLRNANALLETQLQLMTSVGTGGILWADAQLGETAKDLPPSLKSVSIDPDLAWRNYLALAEADVATARSSLKDPETADRYLASLRILVNYSMAISAKFVAIASQLAQATVVKAQIAAANNTMERWKQLEKQARTEEEKLAAMKAMVQARVNAIKRSIFVAWADYRDSYFFLYFEKAPVSINLDMSAAQMKDAFATVSQWIARLLGDAPGKDPIKLPNENVSIDLEFDIVPVGGAAGGSTDIAVLADPQSGIPRTLTWALAIGTDQLRGVLPNNGEVAIWITKAEFFIEGVKPNSKGNVIVTVGTSGTYRNGFGPSRAYNFVTKGLVGNYAYKEKSGAVYNPWAIDIGVYMTPTPFTQWQMTFDPDGGDPSTATRLRVRLVVAYRTR